LIRLKKRSVAGHRFACSLNEPHHKSIEQQVRCGAVIYQDLSAASALQSATPYVTTQPMAGAFRPRVLYRLAGIATGALVTIAIAPNLQNSPVLLVLCLAIWIGLCIYRSFEHLHDDHFARRRNDGGHSLFDHCTLDFPTCRYPLRH